MSARTSNNTVHTLTAVLAIVITVGVAVQAFLAMSSFAGAGADAINVHRVLGIGLLVLGVALVGVAIGGYRDNRGIVGHAASIPILMVAAVGVAKADSWLGGLHGFLAVALAVAASSLAAITLRMRRG